MADDTLCFSFYLFKNDDAHTPWKRNPKQDKQAHPQAKQQQKTTNITRGKIN